MNRSFRLEREWILLPLCNENRRVRANAGARQGPPLAFELAPRQVSRQSEHNEAIELRRGGPGVLLSAGYDSAEGRTRRTARIVMDTSSFDAHAVIPIA